MGSNNHLSGRVAEVCNGRVRLEGEGFSLWGEGRGRTFVPGQSATALIRLERTRLAEGNGENRLKAPLTSTLYLGDRFEYLFHLGEEASARLRTCASRTRRALLELPQRTSGSSEASGPSRLALDRGRITHILRGFSPGSAG